MKKFTEVIFVELDEKNQYTAFNLVPEDIDIKLYRGSGFEVYMLGETLIVLCNDNG